MDSTQLNYTPNLWYLYFASLIVYRRPCIHFYIACSTACRCHSYVQACQSIVRALALLFPYVIYAFFRVLLYIFVCAFCTPVLCMVSPFFKSPPPSSSPTASMSHASAMYCCTVSTFLCYYIFMLNLPLLSHNFLHTLHLMTETLQSIFPTACADFHKLWC